MQLHASNHHFRERVNNKAVKTRNTRPKAHHQSLNGLSCSNFEVNVTKPSAEERSLATRLLSGSTHLADSYEASKKQLVCTDSVEACFRCFFGLNTFVGLICLFCWYRVWGTVKGLNNHCGRATSGHGGGNRTRDVTGYAVVTLDANLQPSRLPPHLL